VGLSRLVKESVQVYNLQGKAVRRIRVPQVFQTPIRRDIIRKTVLSAQSRRYQPQGRNPKAGERTTAVSLGVGHGLARVPRVKGRQNPSSGKGALATMTVGGRQAHPPKSEKKIAKSINKKERQLAIRSAVAATGDKMLVTSRGHSTDNVLNFPLVVVDEIEELKRLSDIREVLLQLGLWHDIERVKKGIKVRAGRGKSRGRRLKRGKGPLIVVGEDKGIVKAARNLPGVDIIRSRFLGSELLAPGTHPGRLTLWSESAFKELTSLDSRGGLNAD
jgi:large subunit ribosomal protein L4e